MHQQGKQDDASLLQGPKEGSPEEGTEPLTSSHTNQEQAVAEPDESSQPTASQIKLQAELPDPIPVPAEIGK